VLAKVPEGMQAEVKDAYWALFDTEELGTPPGPKLAEIIDARITAMAARYQATYPAAMKCLLTDREGLTAYLRCPAEHHKRVRHSNFIERTFGETRRRTKVSFLRPASASWPTSHPQGRQQRTPPQQSPSRRATGPVRPTLGRRLTVPRSRTRFSET
jgi:hypothetical protein